MCHHDDLAVGRQRERPPPGACRPPPHRRRRRSRPARRVREPEEKHRGHRLLVWAPCEVYDAPAINRPPADRSHDGLRLVLACRRNGRTCAAVPKPLSEDAVGIEARHGQRAAERQIARRGQVKPATTMAPPGSRTRAVASSRPPKSMVATRRDRSRVERAVRLVSQHEHVATGRSTEVCRGVGGDHDLAVRLEGDRRRVSRRGRRAR